MAVIVLVLGRTGRVVVSPGSQDWKSKSANSAIAAEKAVSCLLMGANVSCFAFMAEFRERNSRCCPPSP